MEPVRVAMITGKMNGGGVEKTLMSYLRGVDRAAVSITLLIDEDSKQIPTEEIARCKADYILIPPYQRPVSYHRFLYRLFREKQYDAVHAHINTLCVFPLFAAWRARVPIRIVHNHSTAGKGEWAKNMLKYALRPFAKAFATHCCACSDYAGHWMFGQANFQVMPNQIDFDYSNYAFDPALRKRTREEFGIGNELVIGVVGRFTRQKNQMFALDVLKEVKKRCPLARILFVGDGPMLDEVREQARYRELSNSVIFAGLQNDMRRMYSAMDVLLMPSLYEGYPLVAQEAVASGLNVVCSINVPEEANKLNGTMTFLSLDAPTASWADCVLTHSNVKSRDAGQYVQAAGYNAKKTAQALTLWYETLQEGVL